MTTEQIAALLAKANEQRKNQQEQQALCLIQQIQNQKQWVKVTNENNTKQAEENIRGFQRQLLELDLTFTPLTMADLGLEESITPPSGGS